MSEWFEHWFGDAYLELYPHRDEAEASQVVALLARLDVVRPGDTVLDLACGAGRHSVALAVGGTHVYGLDLSLPLLRAARRRGVETALIRADMRRLPCRTGGFDAVVNLFTSFGYFTTDAEHQCALDEVARVLKPGGRFALDFLNAPAVRRNLVPRDERTIGGRRVVQERRLDDEGRNVIKTIDLADEGRTFMERVRLFERADLERMLAASGLRVDDALGDYEGKPYTPYSPRLLLLATRT